MPKQAARLTIDSDLIREAKELNLNISEAAEIGVRAKVRETRASRWKRENKESIESMNSHVEEHGLWCDNRRAF